MAMTPKFNLYLTGHALAGHENAAAAAALARLVRLPEAQAAGLLAGRETLVKQNLDEAQAQQYLRVLEQAGVGARREEILTAEAPSAADEPIPAVETIACPACGTVQPKRTLCRQCSADMPRMIAAREDAARQPSPPAGASIEEQAARILPESGEVPPYRRSRLLEILLFLFTTMLWGYFAMTDRGRGPAVRVFGGAMFVVFGVGTFTYLYSFFIGDEQKLQAVRSAHVYAAEIADKVGEYALAKQELPDDGAEIALPQPRPYAVESVTVGPAGHVRVRLHGEFSTAGNGSITYSPYIEGRKLNWACKAENIATKYIAKNCG